MRPAKAIHFVKVDGHLHCDFSDTSFGLQKYQGGEVWEWLSDRRRDTLSSQAGQKASREAVCSDTQTHNVMKK